MDITTPRQIGKSIVKVTPLGLGCGTIGSTDVSNPTSFATIDSAWETGVRFFDTAPW